MKLLQLIKAWRKLEKKVDATLGFRCDDDDEVCFETEDDEKLQRKTQ